MIIQMNEFTSHVGEIMMYCQCIEHDIKEIYLSFFKDNREEVLHKMNEEKWTLGMIVTALKEADKAPRARLFDDPDYSILFSTVRLRNYYAHQVFLSFCYEIDEEKFEASYNQAAKRLLSERKLLSSLYGRVEDVRIKLQEKA